MVIHIHFSSSRRLWHLRYRSSPASRSSNEIDA